MIRLANADACWSAMQELTLNRHNYWRRFLGGEVFGQGFDSPHLHNENSIGSLSNRVNGIESRLSIKLMLGLFSLALYLRDSFWSPFRKV